MQQPPREQIEENNMSWMVKHTFDNANEDWLVQQLRRNHKIMIISDGSYHPVNKVGTSAWVITAETNTSRRIHGDNVIPGEHYLQCPHRS